jgi:hypothetical protein
MAAIGGRPARSTRSIRLRVAAFNNDRGLVWWLLMKKGDGPVEFSTALTFLHAL